MQSVSSHAFLTSGWKAEVAARRARRPGEVVVADGRECGKSASDQVGDAAM